MRKNVFWAAAFLLLERISPVLAQVPASFADLAEKLQPTVVNISTTHSPEDFSDSEEVPGIASTNPRVEDFFNPRRTGQLSLGSGFIIDQEGYIITNNHVIDKAQEINVTFADNTQAQARLVGADSKLDLALIKVDGKKDLSAAKLGDSDKIRVGDWILAIGNPFGLGGSMTAGIVSAKSRDIEAGPYDNFIQTDASINQGSSGGPMFNMDGEVIGINTAIFSTNGGSMGIGFAVPINLGKFVIRELKTKGKVDRGWLGIRIQPNSTDISSSVGQPWNLSGGVLVSSVTDGSGAKAAGIQPGDIILSMNGKAVDDARVFSRIVAETAPGTTVELEIWRDKQILKKNLEIQAMPEEPKPSVKPFPESPAQASEHSEGLIEDLGVEVAEADAEVLNKFHLENGKPGVVILRVLPGSDAEGKGLQAGNLITQIDKKDIFDINDVKTYVEEARLENNRPVLLLINDNNIPHYAAVKLSSHE